MGSLAEDLAAVNRLAAGGKLTAEELAHVRSRIIAAWAAAPLPSRATAAPTPTPVPGAPQPGAPVPPGMPTKAAGLARKAAPLAIGLGAGLLAGEAMENVTGPADGLADIGGGIF